jgi:hypothetical protein
VRKLEGAFNRVTTQNKVLQLENEGLLASLDTENKRTTHGWRLPLGGKKKCATDAVFWSPVSSRRPKLYRPRKIVKKRMKSLKEVLEQIHELRMPSRRKMMQIGSVWNQRRQRRWRRRKRLMTPPASWQKSNRRTARKLSKLPKKGKHKASTLLPKQQKPQKQVSGGAASNVAPSAASPASARTTSRGRTVTLPSKFR